MSKITQYVRHLAVVAIATLLAQCAWAEGGVVSINMCKAFTVQTDQETLAGTVPVANWIVCNENSGVHGSKTDATTGVSVEWDLVNRPAGTCDVRTMKVADTCEYFKSGLCRGNRASAQYTISIGNIPYAVYEAYVYFTLDNYDGTSTPYPAVTVNDGNSYRVNNGALEIGTGNWGTGPNADPGMTAPVLNENAICIDFLSGSTLKLSGTCTRGAIAAIQIVEVSAKMWTGNNGNWDEASNWSPAGVPTAEDDVLISSACTLTLSDASVAKTVTLADNVTFAGSETGAVLGEVIVATGKKMTISADTTVGITGGSLKQTEVTNNGTIKFIGGTEANPIKIYDNGANNNTGFGNVKLAENTVVLNAEDNNRIHKVTGSGASSIYKLTRPNNGFGHTGGSLFRNLTYVNAADANTKCWVERADSFDATADVRLDGGEFYLYGYSPTIGSLSGSAALTRGGSETLTITCGTDAEYTGASSVPMTIAVGNGVQTLSGAYTGALTVNDGGRVRIAGNAKPASYTVAEGGQVVMANGNIASMREIPAWMSFEDGVTQLSIIETAGEFTSGTVSITGVPESITSIQMFTLDWKYVTLVKDPESAGAWSYTTTPSTTSGPAVWLDYTFLKDTLAKRRENNTTIENAGSAGAGVVLTYDTGYRANPTGTDKDAYNAENGMLLAASTPYRAMNGDSAWPTAYTVAVCANVPDVENACLVGFGSSTDGNKTFVAIVRGKDSNTIKLVKGVGMSNPATEITSMSADNATSSKHLIVFTNDGTTFKVYCDGVKIEETSAIALGNGFQIGSVHGGVPNNLVRCSGISDEAKRLACEIKSIRVFNKVISDDEMTALVDEFPYISKGGLYERTISADTTLSAEAVWADSETKATTDLPASVTEEGVTYKPSLHITTTATSKLTLNASLDADKITFDGAGELQIYSEGENTISAAGAVIVNGPIAFKHGLVDISKSPLKIGTEGVMRIDVDGIIDLSTIFATTRIQLTGVTEEAEDKIILLNAPESDAYRTVALVFEENHYWLKVTIAEREAMTLSVGSDLELTDATEFTAEGGKTIHTNPEDVIEISADCTITIPSALTIPLASITIPEGKTLTLVRGEGVACPKILGAGTIVMSQVPGRVFQDTDWSGVVYLKNINLSDWDIGAYGNMDQATIKLTGVTGYSKNGTSNNGCNAAIELADDGETKALTINNGYSDAIFFFRKVTGSGTFSSTSDNISSQVYQFHDVTGFTGMLEAANNIRIVVGNCNADTAASSMTFADGVVINGGLNWSAAKVVFGNTLKVKGSVGDAIVTATTLPEMMPAVTLVDGETETTGYTLVNDNGTLKVALKTYTITIPTVEHADVIVIVNGSEVTPVEGAITVNHGDKVVVTYTAAEDYTMETVTQTIESAGADATIATTDVEPVLAKTATELFIEAIDRGDSAVALSGDVTVPSKVVISGTVALDLAGHKLTATAYGNDYLIVVNNGAKLTITDSSKTEETAGTGVVEYLPYTNFQKTSSMIKVLGELVVEGGTLKSDYSVVKVDEDPGKGKFTLNGGTLEVVGSYDGLTYTAMVWGDAILNAGTIKGKVQVLASEVNKVSNFGTVTVNGGSYDPDFITLITHNAEYFPIAKIKSSITDLTVVPGTAKGYLTTDVIKVVDGAAEEGYAVYTLAAKTATELFLEAIAAGESSIALTGDVTVPSVVVISGEVTIDLAGHKLTATAYGNNYLIVVSNGAKLTITDSAEGGVVEYLPYTNFQKTSSMIKVLGELVVEGGTLKSDYSVVKVDEDPGKGKFTLNGGTLEVVGSYDGLTYTAMVWGDAILNAGTIKGKVQVLASEVNKVSNFGTVTVNGGSYDPDFITLITHNAEYFPIAKIASSITDLTVVPGTAKGYLAVADIEVVDATAEEGYVVKTLAIKSADLPGAEEVPADQKDAYNTWAEKNGVTESTTTDTKVLATAFAMGVTVSEAYPTIEAAAAKAVEDEVPTIDMAELVDGDLEAAVAAIQAKYGDKVTVELVEAEELTSTETAKFYKLSITIKK